MTIRALAVLVGASMSHDDGAGGQSIVTVPNPQVAARCRLEVANVTAFFLALGVR
jgi:hypothetical protein